VKTILRKASSRRHRCREKPVSSIGRLFGRSVDNSNQFVRFRRVECLKCSARKVHVPWLKSDNYSQLVSVSVITIKLIITRKCGAAYKQRKLLKLQRPRVRFTLRKTAVYRKLNQLRAVDVSSETPSWLNYTGR